ncbi:hypothetical protein [Plantactinospora sp. WMMB782]|uniref:hypothetical protein n=1 Tax=Plantactinospora sp. WMMB782 TaxID=3404121 RepID=UPI003B95C483
MARLRWVPTEDDRLLTVGALGCHPAPGAAVTSISVYYRSVLTRTVTSALLAASVTLLGTGVAANADEIRQFRGEGYSSMGLAYDWAYGQALGRAREAGFTDCDVIDSYVSPGGYEAWVLLECDR